MTAGQSQASKESKTEKQNKLMIVLMMIKIEVEGTRVTVKAWGIPLKLYSEKSNPKVFKKEAAVTKF